MVSHFVLVPVEERICPDVPCEVYESVSAPVRRRDERVEVPETERAEEEAFVRVVRPRTPIDDAKLAYDER